MQAIILAGGFGTRLRKVVSDRPKPMAIVNGRPFLEYILDNLIKAGFTSVVFAVGYMHEFIEDYFQNNYKGMDIKYSVEVEALGTGGCIMQALKYTTDEYVYVMNGDTYFDIDFKKLKTSKDIMIACKYMENFDRYGEVVINSNNRILAFNEKQPKDKGFINGGIYVLNRNVFDRFNLDKKFSLETDFFNPHMTDLYIEAYKSCDYFMDIGIPEDYLKFIKDMQPKALFLDRDGVINYDYGHVYKIEDFKFMPDIFEICRKYEEAGYKIIVISNQAGIAKGMYTKVDLDKLDLYMKNEFKKQGINILDSFYCPHKSEDNCDCRKPKPGLLFQARDKYYINLLESTLIGDKISDLEAGYNAGIKDLYFKKGKYEETPVEFEYKVI